MNPNSETLPSKTSCWLAVALVCCCGLPWCASGAETNKGEPAAKPAKVPPIAGEVFTVQGHTAFLILPRAAAAGQQTPWVWYFPTLPGLPGPEEKWMFQKWQAAGLAVAGLDAGESYGSPAGCALFSALYKELVQQRGLSPTPCLLGRSRGGLMLYNWAVENPSRVACIAGIYPVCNLSSYPGLRKASAAYGLTEEQLAAALTQHNPMDRLEPLAKARVPIYHIHGDSDTVVPLEQNSGALAQRYRQLGGTITLHVVKGQGHNMWSGWFEGQELVDFVITHAHPRSTK
jgi:predicted esterase